MKVFIAGIDGYLGWPLAQYLAVRGHDIGGADNFFRRRWVEEMGSCSALPIAPMTADQRRNTGSQRTKMLAGDGLVDCIDQR
jgi:nucleoside-diphosphate-sugar epimerase